ncbi:esterase-like activity of phytase family protein [Nitrobacter sp. JJSN]|uniref:esterase-like activity of phytase family protein n=1 Tax=Nitrobacter sp. JJSN TaxID=3453033 RepID=UPI003F75E048
MLKWGISLAAIAATPAPARAQFATHPLKQSPPDELTPPAPVSITVNARPISSFDLRDRSRTRFGALAFRSGLILTSSFRGFGGLSSLRLDPKGQQFISASDKGTWFTGRIVYRAKEMTGLADVEAAPMLGADGRPITAHHWFDTESIALDGSLVYVGIERVNRIMRFDFGKGFTRAHGEEVDVPPAIRKLPFNQGLEAMVVVPRDKPLGGTLIAISERGLDAGQNIVAFLIGGPSPGQFAIRRTDYFDISDACLLPSGDLLILERKFSLTGGIGIRIRRIAMKAVAPGALVDGPSIFDADLGQEIDNFEGIDAYANDNGEIVLTLVSDDNFSLIQRTLLLQFTLVD